jgi:hypothetical protein
MDRLAAAMQAQAEALHKIHEGQERLADAVRDERRSDMMINSTRSLNESFHGMRRVQEKLLDRIQDSSERRVPWWAVVVGLLALTGAVVWGVAELGDTVSSTGAALAREQGRTDPQVAAIVGSMDELKKRLEIVESSERKLWEDELARMQESVLEIGAERGRLKQERDELLQEIGALKARMLEAEGRVAEAENVAARAKERLSAAVERADYAEGEVRRFTAKALEDQKLIGELNRVLEAQRTGAPAPAVASSAAETRRLRTVDPSGRKGFVEVPVSSDEPASPVVAPSEAPAASEPVPVPASPPASDLLAPVNNLLSQHRGSDEYRFTRIDAVEGDRLKGVTLEVRGRDGSVAKTVEADYLHFVLTPQNELLEMEFEKGMVVFHRPTGRDIKSPFFNNRYQIVVIGIDSQVASRSGFSFLKLSN